MKLTTIVFAGLIWAGCYDPNFKNGIACDPGGSCPSGTACGADNICRAPGTGPGTDIPDAPVAIDAGACQASTVVCDGRGHVVTCGAEGTVTSDVTCPLGCAATGATCAKMEVSNGLTHFLGDAAAGVDMKFPNGTTTITASTGKVVINGADVSVASEVVNGMRVFAFHSLTVDGQLLFAREFNTPAIAFVVDGPVAITGLIDVSGTEVIPGPGALGLAAATTAGCLAGRGGHDSTGTLTKNGGGAGGGGYHSGAAGGSGQQLGGGSPGASPFGDTLVPLRGGCAGGQSGAGFSSEGGGGGGGAIQIVSATSIKFSDQGTIDAGGGGGFATPQQAGSDGAGGGGGGAILLEAPSITLSGAGVVLAAKGGGGGGTGMNVNGTDIAIGEDGGTGAAPALGGFQTSPGTFLHGGNGGTVDIAPTVGPSSASDFGAAGGGGVGQVRFNTRDGTAAVTGGAVVRAPLALGTIKLQTP